MVCFAFSANGQFARLKELFNIKPTILEQINKYDIVDRNFVDTIPIEFTRNTIYLTVFIGDNAHRFILDTGSDGVGLHSNTIAGHCKIIGKTNVSDVNNSKAKLDVVNIPSLHLDGLELSDCPAIVLSEQPYLRLGIEGCIGNNILKNKLLKIDVRHKRMILTDDVHYFDADSGYVFPFKTYLGYCPYFTVYPTDGLEETAYFDTGNTSFYAMTNRTYRFMKEKGFKIDVIDSGYGKTTLGALGNEDNNLSLRLKLKDFMLGNLSIKNVETELYQDVNSSMGADLLNYGTLILDYISNHITFIPYTEPVVVEADRHPFSLITENGVVKIGRVWQNSILYRLGLRSGFVVKKVNGMSAASASFILSLIRSANGPTIIECTDFSGRPFKFSVDK
jgi:hypothetical protein